MPPPAPKINGEASSSAKKPSRNQLKRDKKKARKHTQPDGPTDSERETDAESSVAESEMDFELEVRLHYRLAQLATRASAAVGGWELTALCVCFLCAQPAAVQTPSSSTVDLAAMDPEDPNYAAFSAIFAHFQPEADPEGGVAVRSPSLSSCPSRRQS